MRLFIAEKPDMGIAIAAALPGPHKRERRRIVCGNDDVVVWCMGHILEQCKPEDYDPALKKWDVQSLPFVPNPWQLKQIAGKTAFYQTIKKEIQNAHTIVHAGDPDREGQLLVDEVLDDIGVPNNIPVKRLIINDLAESEIKKALGALRDNAEFESKGRSALARSRADYLYGINLTRLYTVLGRDNGYTGVLSVGRVQTPLLALVVRRDDEIDKFIASDYYAIDAEFDSMAGRYAAKWQPATSSLVALDSEGRAVNRQQTEQIANKLTRASGTITEAEIETKTVNPPLPFALADLQKLAAKERGIAPDVTLEAVQSLYEKHKVLTYPRSDVRYLPEGHYSVRQNVIAAIVAGVGDNHPLAHLVGRAQFDIDRKSGAWADNKMEGEAHHAIIPTQRAAQVDQMTADERWIYEAVCHRYLMQFFSPHIYEARKLVAAVIIGLEVEHFAATGKTIIERGWQQWRFDNADREEGDETTLPPLIVGDNVQCKSAEVVDKKTQPPKRFTLESLLDAMTGIARYVKDPYLAKTLRDTDGLGRPATQASIIKLLFDRGFLETKKKAVYSTATARALVAALPEPVTLPDMTARWEQTLAKIADGKAEMGILIDSVEAQVVSLVEAARGGEGVAVTVGTSYPCPGSNCGGNLRRIKGKKGFFWGCSNYGGGCKETRPDSKGKPGSQKTISGGPKVKAAGDKCPTCKKGRLKMSAFTKGANAGKNFLGCSAFPVCKHFQFVKSHDTPAC